MATIRVYMVFIAIVLSLGVMHAKDNSGGVLLRKNRISDLASFDGRGDFNRCDKCGLRGGTQVGSFTV